MKDKFCVDERGERVDVCFNYENAHGQSDPRHWLLTWEEAKELQYRLNRYMTEAAHAR